MWIIFQVDGYSVCAKQYARRSRWGINGGHISKLEMRKDGQIAISYDRGWGIKPQNEMDKAALDKVLAEFN